MRDNILGFAVLALVTAMIVAGTGAEAQEVPAATQKTGGEAVGASIVHPAAWNVERQPYTMDRTYGYTLWYPETEATHDHGGRPALRVSLAYDLEPEDIDGEVDEILADYPDLSQRRQTVDVARRYEGVAVGPLPGSTPYTAVYVPVNGRVYEIDVYADDPGTPGLGEVGRELLSDIRFEPPSRSVESLDLPGANSPEELYPTEAEARAIRATGESKASDGEYAAASPTISGRAGSEQRIAEGCWQADPDFFVRTQHGPKSNRGDSDGGIPTGFTKIGIPNFWGQYTHGSLGYGRCTKPYYTNDKFAVDYPLDRNNRVFSPFRCGTVTKLGRNKTHEDYGKFVAIRACNGKYVNLSAHLSDIRGGLGKGDRVTQTTILGYAGDSGGPNIEVGQVHLHTAFYRYPQMNEDGSPYGGAGLKIARNRYVGTAARRKGFKVSSHVYNYAMVAPGRAFCREGRGCGEKYLVSN